MKTFSIYFIITVSLFINANCRIPIKMIPLSIPMMQRFCAYNKGQTVPPWNESVNNSNQKKVCSLIENEKTDPASKHSEHDFAPINQSYQINQSVRKCGEVTHVDVLSCNGPDQNDQTFLALSGNSPQCVHKVVMITKSTFGGFTMTVDLLNEYCIDSEDKFLFEFIEDIIKVFAIDPVVEKQLYDFYKNTPQRSRVVQWIELTNDFATACSRIDRKKIASTEGASSTKNTVFDKSGYQFNIEYLKISYFSIKDTITIPALQCLRTKMVEGSTLLMIDMFSPRCLIEIGQRDTDKWTTIARYCGAKKLFNIHDELTNLYIDLNTGLSLTLGIGENDGYLVIQGLGKKMWDEGNDNYWSSFRNP